MAITSLAATVTFEVFLTLFLNMTRASKLNQSQKSICDSELQKKVARGLFLKAFALQ
jgi:hypothetical protein